MKSLIKLLLVELFSFLLLACSSKDSAIKTEKLEPINIDSLIFNQKQNKELKKIAICGNYFNDYSKLLKMHKVIVQSLDAIDYSASMKVSEPIGGTKAIIGEINYPEIAKRAEIEGTIAIEFDVDSLGYTSNFSVIKGIGGLCEQYSIVALEKTRFTPTLIKNQPSSFRYRIILRFVINPE